MTDPTPTSGAKIGPGRLVLVVGPSGAGKDTLIGLARSACADDGEVVFARRVVTRPASVAEDNEQMTPDAFWQAQARGAFSVHWEAHGLLYALPREIDRDIRTGRTVVANVSRMVIDVLRQTYAHVSAVSVTAPPDILAERLAGRGRLSDGSIAERLRRDVDPPRADVTIQNVGDPDDHASELVRIIRQR